MFELVGTRMDCSLAAFAKGCIAFLEQEQAKACPDTHLIVLLCNAVRLTYEHEAQGNTIIDLHGKLLEAEREIDRLGAVLAEVDDRLRLVAAVLQS